MLSLGKFPSQVQCNNLLHNPVFLQFPSKPHGSLSIRPNFNAVAGKAQTGLCCNALKTKKNGGFSLQEAGGSDEFEEDFDDEFLGLDEIEDDDDEVIVPLENMKQWLQNKPRGFGEGREYDTSIEDKLMEEIEQSRKAQLANINKLKDSPLKTTSHKETLNKDKGPVLSQDGFRVRLVNLPKKKNIHKDLRLAFKEVPGVVNIVPVVSGNEKTRDPVCKGLAFIDFKNQEEAHRFVQNFSGKSISFGKVQKQIKCEMTNSNSDKGLNVGVEAGVSLSDSSEESISGESDDEDVMRVSGQREEENKEEEEEEEDGEINGTSTTSDSNFSKELEMEVGEEYAIDSSSSKQTRKIKKVKMNEKKVAPKGRKDKSPKLGIPGSANKLKIREKALLSGVFSKYGANAASAVKEQSR